MNISKRDMQNNKERPIENPAMADIFSLSEGTSARIRMLIDFDDLRAAVLKWHNNPDQKIDRPCTEEFDIDCADCTSTDRKTRNNEPIFAWPLWDYEAGHTRLLVGRENKFTLVGKLFEYYQERGSIIGRDFLAKRFKEDASSKFPTYVLVPEDPSKFQFEKKVYIPDADTITKTIILAYDLELAEALGITMEERLSAKEQRAAS